MRVSVFCMKFLRSILRLNQMVYFSTILTCFLSIPSKLSYLGHPLKRPNIRFLAIFKRFKRRLGINQYIDIS